MRRGINILQKRTVENLYKNFEEKFNYKIISEKETPTLIVKTPVVEKPSLTHNELQDLVFEIGKLNRFLSEKEYPMENERLDVVWRRVERSVPTYVFEVQIGGDIYHAIGKLKHAFDLWNSNIFLILNQSDIETAKSLLSGTFHEINSKLKIILPNRIYELYERKRQWMDIEKEIGLL